MLLDHGVENTPTASCKLLREGARRRRKDRFMRGKYQKWIVHTAASLAREVLRRKLAKLVHWEPLNDPVPGCTAIIGDCSSLPNVLMANLRCLEASRWPDLKQVIAVFDRKPSIRTSSLVSEALSAFPQLNLQFFHYSDEQHAAAERYKLGYLYAWLSWCIAIKHAKTEHVLFHDYDALLLGAAIGKRYTRYINSDAKVQGIRWYNENGINENDRLATTFEAFMNTRWLRSRAPIELFNKFRIVDNRSIDFDTTLDAQFGTLDSKDRDIAPMRFDELMHPSQMICQYTAYRKSPAAPLPCFSIPMIPFFNFLSRGERAIEEATFSLKTAGSRDVDLLRDGTRINLAALNVDHVHWILRQILQACQALSIAPTEQIYRYGEALYDVTRTSDARRWIGEDLAIYRPWIETAASKPLCLEAELGLQ